MEQSLTLAPAERPALRIAFARLLQTLGWAGLFGLVLLAAAAFVARSAESKRHDVARLLDSVSIARQVPVASIAAAPEQPVFKLPRRADIPLLLTRVERAVVDNGLPWAAGDYRFIPATEHQAATLEVRCAFKAPYPKVRAMLAEVIGSVPAFTIREMSFSRQSIDSPDVDAKFVIALFLADEEGMSPTSSER